MKAKKTKPENKDIPDIKNPVVNLFGGDSKNSLIIQDISRGRMIELHSDESIEKLIGYSHHIQENFFTNNKSKPEGMG